MYKVSYDARKVYDLIHNDERKYRDYSILLETQMIPEAIRRHIIKDDYMICTRDEFVEVFDCDPELADYIVEYEGNTYYINTFNHI